jgi:hypothetical protein
MAASDVPLARESSLKLVSAEQQTYENEESGDDEGHAHLTVEGDAEGEAA